MRVLSARFTIAILKGLAGIALSGFAIVFLRDLLANVWQIAIPPLIYAMLIPAAILCGLWFGSGKFIRQLIDEHQKGID